MIAGDIHVWLIIMEISAQQTARPVMDGNAVGAKLAHIAMVDEMLLKLAEAVDLMENLTHILNFRSSIILLQLYLLPRE